MRFILVFTMARHCDDLLPGSAKPDGACSNVPVLPEVPPELPLEAGGAAGAAPGAEGVVPGVDGVAPGVAGVVPGIVPVSAGGAAEGAGAGCVDGALVEPDCSVPPPVPPPPRLHAVKLTDSKPNSINAFDVLKFAFIVIPFN